VNLVLFKTKGKCQKRETILNTLIDIILITLHLLHPCLVSAQVPLEPAAKQDRTILFLVCFLLVEFAGTIDFNLLKRAIVVIFAAAFGNINTANMGFSHCCKLLLTLQWL